MARRGFLFLVVPANLVENAKQKSSAPPLTHDGFTPAQLASRFELYRRAGFSKSGPEGDKFVPLLLISVGSYPWM